MSTSGLLLVLLTAGLTMAANLMLRAGIETAGAFSFGSASKTGQALLHLFMQPLFSIGFVIYFVASIVWIRVIATEPLSVAYPVLVSLTFTLVTGGAILLFGEPLSARKIVGVAIILAGIIVVSVEGRVT